MSDKPEVHRADLRIAYLKLVGLAVDLKEHGHIAVSIEYYAKSDDVYVRAHPKRQGRASTKDYRMTVCLSPIGYSLNAALMRLENSIEEIGFLNDREEMLHGKKIESPDSFHPKDWAKIIGRKA